MLRVHERRQQLEVQVLESRLEQLAPTNRYGKYCRHTTLNICLSLVSCRYSSATGGTDLPTHLAVFQLCAATFGVASLNLETYLIPCSWRESVFVKLVLQGTRDLESKLPSPTEDTSASAASVTSVADGPSRSPTELVESTSLGEQMEHEGSDLPQKMVSAPERQLPLENFDECLQSEEHEVAEYF